MKLLSQLKVAVFALISLLIILKFCCPKDDNINMYSNILNSKALVHSTTPITFRVNKNIIVEKYFEYIDSIVHKYDSITSYKLSEHLLDRI